MVPRVASLLAPPLSYCPALGPPTNRIITWGTPANRIITWGTPHEQNHHVGDPPRTEPSRGGPPRTESSRGGPPTNRIITWAMWGRQAGWREEGWREEGRREEVFSWFIMGVKTRCRKGSKGLRETGNHRSGCLDWVSGLGFNV